MPIADAVVLTAVLLVTLFGSLIQVVGAGIILASVLFMKQSCDLAESRTSVNPISTIGGDRLSPGGTNLEIVEEGVFVKHIYGLYAIEDAVLDIEREGAIVVFSGVESQPIDMMRRIDIIPDLVPEAHIFDTYEEAMAWVRSYVNGKPA